ncbi:epimerase [Terriglobus sp. RCC_193]|uniref:epimerase n=1 Tax=Terriglobus sp. RCC_193 TaxID=3239218 RepID=UPI003526B6CF
MRGIAFRMRVIVLGGSGMVGQGVLRECLLDTGVSEVLSVGRRALDASVDSAVDRRSPKLRELVCPEEFASLDFTSVADALTGCDACFFPLGVSSVGMKEAEYTRITRDLTLAVARVLAERNSSMVFVYVSGEGTDANSKTMWSRVKGGVENALMAMPFRAAYAFRPGLILAKHGIRSKVAIYNFFYRALFPLVWVLGKFPKLATDTETVGRAMLRVAKETPQQRVWNTAAINSLGR